MGPPGATILFASSSIRCTIIGSNKFNPDERSTIGVTILLKNALAALALSASETEEKNRKIHEIVLRHIVEQNY